VKKWHSFSDKRWLWIFGVCLWGMATILYSVLASQPLASGAGDNSVASRVMGKCVTAFAETAFDRAELAFHSGRPQYREKAFSNDLFQVWHREIAPTGHAHLEGGQTKEVLAWLRFASLLDPHSVKYHLIAAFWLQGKDIGRPDEARRVLLEARAKNPESYVVYMGLGRLYAKTDDKLLAHRCYDRALVLWPRGKAPDDDQFQTNLDKRELLSRRAILREIEGDTAGAISDMKSIVELFPASPLIMARLLLLETGQKPQDSPAQRWGVLRNPEYHPLCEDASHEHDEPDDPHEHDGG